MWHWYRELLRCRREVPALARLDKKAMEVATICDNVLFVRRQDGESRAILVFHFAGAEKTVDLPLPKGRWRKTMDSEHPRWGGSARTVADELISQGRVTLTLVGWQFLSFIEKMNAKGGRQKPKSKRGRVCGSITGLRRLSASAGCRSTPPPRSVPDAAATLLWDGLTPARDDAREIAPLAGCGLCPTLLPRTTIGGVDKAQLSKYELGQSARCP